MKPLQIFKTGQSFSIALTQSCSSIVKRKSVQQTKIKLAIHCELNKKSRKNQTVLINSSRKFKIGQSFPKKF